MGCVPTFSLVYDGAGPTYNAYPGANPNFVKISASGALSYDQTMFGDDTVRIKITANGGYSTHTNPFRVRHTCNPLTVSNIPDYTNCYLPANPP